MKLTQVLTALVAAILFAVPAGAQTLLFEITPTTTTDTRSFSFQLEQGRTPSSVTSTGVRFNGVPFNFTVPGLSGSESGPFDGPTFQVLNNQGGIFIARIDRAPIQFQQNSFFGEQLFTGTTANPIFRIGTFDLSTRSRTFTTDPITPVDFRIRISQVVSAVPEPATWATMIGGFGLVGAALRRRAAPRAASA